MATVRKRTWKTGGEVKTAWVADYFDQDGKRHIKTFKRERAAKDWLVKAQHEVKEGTHTPESTSITVAEAADIWLAKAELEGRERSTLAQYSSHVRLHIGSMANGSAAVSRIGNEKLARLTAPMVEAFRDDLLQRCSRPLARKVLVSLKSILREAQRRGLVAQNAALAVTISRDKRDKTKLTVGRDIPSKQEVQILLTKATGRLRPLLITAIFTGMRASELRGLCWGDVDFTRKVLQVRQRADRWRVIGAPKSQSSYREIPLSPMVVNALKEWRLTCPKGELGLVFPNGAGEVEDHSNIIERGLDPLQKQTGILDEDGTPKYGLHAFRHFFASWAIEQGFSPKRVQTLLGHSSIVMTFDIYGHLFPSLEDDHAKFAAGELAIVG